MFFKVSPLLAKPKAQRAPKAPTRTRFFSPSLVPHLDAVIMPLPCGFQGSFVPHFTLNPHRKEDCLFTKPFLYIHSVAHPSAPPANRHLPTSYREHKPALNQPCASSTQAFAHKAFGCLSRTVRQRNSYFVRPSCLQTHFAKCFPLLRRERTQHPQPLCATTQPNTQQLSISPRRRSTCSFFPR